MLRFHQVLIYFIFYFIFFLVELCPIPQVKNATVECSLSESSEVVGRASTDYTWGTVCKTICENGLSPSSMATSVCDSRGNWNPKFPDCIG